MFSPILLTNSFHEIDKIVYLIFVLIFQNWKKTHPGPMKKLLSFWTSQNSKIFVKKLVNTMCWANHIFLAIQIFFDYTKNCSSWSKNSWKHRFVFSKLVVGSGEQNNNFHWIKQGNKGCPQSCLGAIFILHKRVLRLFWTTHPPT